MEGEKTDEAREKTGHAEPCLCRQIAFQIMDAFGVRSEEARQHVRNARIEMLKAMRSIIDERIDQLSKTQQQRGTKIVVE